MRRRMKDSAPVVVFLLLTLAMAFLAGIYAGLEVEGCIYVALAQDQIVCSENYFVRVPIA